MSVVVFVPSTTWEEFWRAPLKLAPQLGVAMHHPLMVCPPTKSWKGRFTTRHLALHFPSPVNGCVVNTQSVSGGKTFSTLVTSHFATLMLRHLVNSQSWWHSPPGFLSTFLCRLSWWSTLFITWRRPLLTGLPFEMEPFSVLPQPCLGQTDSTLGAEAPLTIFFTRCLSKVWVKSESKQYQKRVFETYPISRQKCVFLPNLTVLINSFGPH